MRISHANYFLSFAGSMLQPSALSYKQASIGNTHIISCRHELTSINLNKTKLLSNLFIRETLTCTKNTCRRHALATTNSKVYSISINNLNTYLNEEQSNLTLNISIFRSLVYKYTGHGVHNFILKFQKIATIMLPYPEYNMASMIPVQSILISAVKQVINT